MCRTLARFKLPKAVVFMELRKRLLARQKYALREIAEGLAK